MFLARFGLPQDISTHGAGIDEIINIVHAFMVLLFVGWGIYLVYCLVRFRARPGSRATYEAIKAKPHKYIEVAVIVFEAFLLVGLSMPVWATYKNEPPTDEEAFHVRIVAQQFAWNIHYAGADGVFGRTNPTLVDEVENPIGLDENSPGAADDIVEINVLHLPVDQPISIRLSSMDVIHSFSVPLLRVKQDVIPGMEFPIWFTATQTSDSVRESQKKVIHLQPPGDNPNSRFARKFKNHVVMQDYKGKDGQMILAKSGTLTGPIIEALLAGGVIEVVASPRAPVEIQCAQLCGLGHYRMRGEVILMAPSDFEAWYAEAGAEEEEFFEDDFDD